MNKISLHCIAFITFTLACTQVLAGSRMTVVEDHQNFILADTNPVLLGNQLLFQTTEEHSVTLWSQNTENKMRVVIFEGQISGFQVPRGYTSISNQLLRNENLVFFLVVSNEGEINESRKIWRTDGTQAGTYHLESPDIYKDLVSAQNLVFSHGSGGQIIATDGENVTAHQFNFPNTQNVCAFSLNDLITLDYDSSNGTTYLKRSKYGVVSDIPVPGGNGFFSIDSDNMWRLGDVCYIGLFRNNISPEVLMVSESGEINKLSEQFDTSGMEQIFAFNNRVYARARANGESRLMRFNQNLDGTEKLFEISQGLSMYHAEVLNDYIVGHTTTPYVSPAVSSTHYFDADLNEIPDLGGAFVPVPEYFPTVNGPNYFTTTRYIDMYTSLFADDVAMEFVDLSIKDKLVDEVTSHEERSEVFMLLRDKISGKRSIAMKADAPGIGESINGLWYDPEVLNQGISIHVGERANGSKYVFVTVYTFKDGAPFWLAGVTDIQNPQTSIEVVVGDYKGSNMFEVGTMPTEHVFGTIKLEMTACDYLQARLTSDEFNVVLDLNRIDNVQHLHLCSD